jgi:hypothetical protein
MSVDIIGNTRKIGPHNIFNEILNRILIVVPIIAFIILVMGMAQALEDDFSADNPTWISESTNNQFYIDHDMTSLGCKVLYTQRKHPEDVPSY